jgi:hypothetical protein
VEKVTSTGHQIAEALVTAVSTGHEADGVFGAPVAVGRPAGKTTASTPASVEMGMVDWQALGRRRTMVS